MTTLILLFLFVGLSAFSQNSEFLITGKFKVDGGSNSDAKIVLEKNGQRVKTIEGTSRFDIGLDFDAIYVVSFEKEGYVSKRLRFDTHVPASRKEIGFYPFEFTVEIFEQYDDVNVVVFNQPVGQIAYSDLIDEFDYDTDYTKSIQTQIDQALKEVAEKKEEKAKEEIEKKKQEEIVNKQVTSLSSSAAKNLSSGKTEEAIKDLEEALALKEDPKIAQQLEEAKAKLESEAKQKEQQTNFNNKVSEAEAALAAGDLQNAQQLFEQANGILGGDPKVAKQIENIKKQIQEKEANTQKIDQLLKEAQDALKDGNPEMALEKAKEAQNLGDKESSNDIISKADAAINEKQKAAEAEAAIAEKLNKLIEDAEKALKDENIETALQKIEEAKGVMDSDPRIAALTQQINERQAAIEKEKEATLQKVNQLTKEGDDALAANNPILAKEKAKALEDLGESEAAKRIVAAADILEAEQEKAKAEQAANEKKIASLVTDVEKALKDSDLELARTKLEELKSLGETAKSPELQSQLDDLEKQKALDEEAEKQKQAAFDKAIDEGKKALEAGNLDGAKLARDNAKSIFDNEQIAVLSQDIEAAEEKREAELEAKQAAQAEKEKKIENLLVSIPQDISDANLERASASIDEAEKLGVSAEQLEPLRAQFKAKQNELENQSAKAKEISEAQKAGVSALENDDFENVEKAIKDLTDLGADDEAAKLTKRLNDAKTELVNAEEAKKAQAAKIEKLVSDAQAFLDDSDAKGLSSAIKALEKEDPTNANIAILKEALIALESKQASLAAENEAEKEKAKKREEYQSEIDEAEKLLAKQDLNGAESAFLKALNLMPEESYPKDKLAEIEKLRASQSIAEKEAVEKELLNKKKAEFDNLIAKGEDELSKLDYNGAIATLKEAKQLNIDNEQADALIKQANDAIKAANEAQSADQQAEELAKLLKTGEDALSAQDLDVAETAFEGALVLKPGNQRALDGLAMVNAEKAKIQSAKDAAEEEMAAKKAAEYEQQQQEFDLLVTQANDLVSANKLNPAIEKYKAALKIKDDSEIREKVAEVQAKISELKTEEEKRAREAAELLAANRERELAQLAEIIEEESSKASAPSKEPNIKRPIVQEEKRQVTNAVAIVGDIKMGQEAVKSSPAGIMTQEDKFDSQLKIADRQKEEFSKEERQKNLQDKYKERKTVETEVVGNSTITYVYINRDNFVTVYKKVEHNWGGVFYFVDDRSTNQRFWEYSTE